MKSVIVWVIVVLVKHTQRFGMFVMFSGTLHQTWCVAKSGIYVAMMHFAESLPQPAFTL